MDEQHEVKGTYFYPEALEALFTANQGVDNREFFAEVTLVPEPDNPHSKSGMAISVRWDDRVIGHVSSEQSADLQQIRRIAASGFDAQTKARVWTSKNHSGERRFWVSFFLPEPDLMIPLNDPPSGGFMLLPPGNAIQIGKVSDHTEVLSEYLPASGIGQLLVTLHIFEAGVHKKWDCIEVRLDGERIGELTKVSSEKYVAAVRHFDDLGLITVSRAKVQGSSLAAEAMLHSVQAHMLTEAQLSPTGYQPLPKLVGYESDPSFYKVDGRWPGESSQPSSHRPQTKAKETHSQSSANISEPEWKLLLRPDGTSRANLFQRGYARGIAGKHFPGNRAPRIDYATTGQIGKIIAHYGGDVSEVKKRGSVLLKFLWWVLLFLLGFTALIGLITAPVGLIITGLIGGPFLYHYITRSQLKAPFGKQNN